jgi:hypothetical protein
MIHDPTFIDGKAKVFMDFQWQLRGKVSPFQSGGKELFVYSF